MRRNRFSIVPRRIAPLCRSLLASVAQPVCMKVPDRGRSARLARSPTQGF
jgi:hypothetical protein